MAILGLDIGTRRVGVAISHSGLFAQEHSVVMHRDLDELLMAIGAIVTKEGVDELVVGLPMGADQKETDQVKAIRELARRIGEVTRLPVHFEDESFTSTMAAELLPEADLQTGEIDRLAAKLILEQYLSHRE